MNCWGGGAAQIASSGKVDDSRVTKINHFYNGEYPDPASIRESIRRRIAAESAHVAELEHDEYGIAAVTTDAAENAVQPLTEERPHEWHRLLFPEPGPENISVGRWRDDRLGPMQVVSVGPMGRRPIVHFEAPPAHRLQGEMDRFLEWFNRPETEPDLRKPAVAHLWFVTIHPYDDGNGRIARAITDLALSRCEGTTMHPYSMSAEILRQQGEYYQALMTTQSGSMDVTDWMVWFLDCLKAAMDCGDRSTRTAVSRAKLQVFAQDHALNHRQVKFCERLIEGWIGNITTNRYGRINSCSQQTSNRDINRLMELGVLRRNQASGRSTSYRIEVPLPWEAP